MTTSATTPEAPATPPREAMTQPTLHTPRLVLRPFAPGDAPAVQAIVSAREIADNVLSIPHPYPDGAAALWIGTHAAQWASGTSAIFAMARADDGTLVGAIGLHAEPAHARAELGYWVAVPHWGHGYATEAVTAMLAFAFGTMGLHRVQARHFLHNPSSGRVMQKAGMQLEGVHRGAVRKDGAFLDLAVYAMLAPDWTAGVGRPRHDG